jgi:TolA-binding protein
MKLRPASLIGLFLASAFAAQAQISPTPVVNEEIRDPNSVRMRAVQLERIKRGGGKDDPSRPLAGEEKELRQLREDFEEIQKIQDEIVRVYRTSKKIDFGRIEALADEISHRAIRLEATLFGVAPEKKKKPAETTRPVRDLIILLDEAIGKFVTSPIFSDPRLVDPLSSEKSRLELERVAALSAELVRSAGLNR